MTEQDKQFLSSLVFAMTDLHLKFIEKGDTNSDRTAFCVRATLEDAYIQYNIGQMHNAASTLVMTRGYDSRYLPLEVILHEIGHYKQYKNYMKQRKRRFWDWILGFKVSSGLDYLEDYDIKKDYYERVADRYAHYCTKIISRRIKQWEVWNTILDSK